MTAMPSATGLTLSPEQRQAARPSSPPPATNCAHRWHQPPVELDCPDDLQVIADPDRLLQIVDNLLNDAIVHTPPDTAVRLAAARGEDGRVAIEVLEV